MLKKMGWKEGQPLGLQGRGHVEPLAIDVKTDRSGEQCPFFTFVEQK